MGIPWAWLGNILWLVGRGGGDKNWEAGPCSLSPGIGAKGPRDRGLSPKSEWRPTAPGAGPVTIGRGRFLVACCRPGVGDALHIPVWSFSVRTQSPRGYGLRHFSQITQSGRWEYRETRGPGSGCTGPHTGPLASECLCSILQSTVKHNDNAASRPGHLRSVPALKGSVARGLSTAETPALRGGSAEHAGAVPGSPCLCCLGPSLPRASPGTRRGPEHGS